MSGDRTFYAVYGVPDSKSFPEHCIAGFKDLEKKGILRGIQYPSKGQEIILGKSGAKQTFDNQFGIDLALWTEIKTFIPSDKIGVKAFVIRAEVIGSREEEFEEIRRDLDGKVLKKGCVETLWYAQDNKDEKKRKGKN